MIRVAALAALLAFSPAVRAEEPRTVRAGTDAEVAKAVAGAKPGDTIIVLLC
jgi:hypothetical protein